jgi:hypothetical protein
MLRSLVRCYLVLVSVLAGCTDIPQCIESGCGGIANIQAFGEAGLGTLNDFTLELCVNATCSVTLIQAASVWIDTELHAKVSYEQTDQGSLLYVVLYGRNDDVALGDGDHYSAVIVSPDGSLIMSRAWTATYYEVTSGCQACQHAILVAD